MKDKLLKKRYIIGVITLIGFIIISYLLFTNRLDAFDNTIYEIIKCIRCSFCDRFFKIITYLGNTIPVVVITIALLIYLDKHDRIILGSSMIVTLCINQIIKHLIKRPRPPVEERLITQNGYSFPSGHSMMALCLYGVLIYFVMTKVKDKKKKMFLVSILSLIILLIGLSRIYVRVHYPSDVAAGFLITISILVINITLINNYFRGNKNVKDGNN